MLEIKKGNKDDFLKGSAIRKWPFHEMEVGDYFEVQVVDANSARTASHQYGKKHGCKFASRTIDGVVRVMRVE